MLVADMAHSTWLALAAAAAMPRWSQRILTPANTLTARQDINLDIFSCWHEACSITAMFIPRSIFRRLRRLGLVPWLALACSAPVLAQTAPVQSLERLTAAATAAVQAIVQTAAGPGAQANVEAIPLDPRLRLPACASPLRAIVPVNQAGQERQLVEVACDSGARWRVNLPTRVSVDRVVMVARRPLPRGASFNADDFSLVRQVQGGTAADRVQSADNLHDRRLRRPVAVGAVLTYDMLEPELVIRRGQAVVLLARSGDFEIRSDGLAMQDARSGDRVRVQNLSSRRVVEGIAATDATVNVQP
jgi:flagella basal body P-ring formation protein FlgA